MARELDTLLISLEADTALLRKAMKDAEKAVDGYTDNVDKSLGKNARRFKQHGSELATMAKGYASALAAFAGVGSARDALEQTAHIEKNAAAAEMTTRRYQELGLAARAAGVDHGTFEQALNKFSIGMSQVHASSGEFYEFLRSQLPTVAAQLQATKSTSEAFDAAADALSRMGSAQDRALFATKAFGESSRDLVSTLAKGSVALRDAGARATELGQIIDKEGIDSAKKLDAAYKDVSATLDTAFKRAVVGAGEALEWLAKKRAAAIPADSISIFNVLGIDLSGQSDQQLKDWVSRLQTNIASALDAATTRRGGGISEMIFGPDGGAQDAALKKLEDLRAQLARVRAEMSVRSAKPLSGTMYDPEAWKATVDAVNQLRILPKIPDFSTELDFSAADAMANLRKQRAEANGATLEMLAETNAQEVEQFRRMLAEKKISEEEFAEVRASLAIVTTKRVTDELEKENQALQQRFDGFRQAIEGPLSSALDNVFAGKAVKADEFFASVLQGLAKAAVQLAIIKPLMTALFPGGTDTTGGVTGLLSGLFGARAGGGSARMGAPILVGERGPEIFRPDAAGTVIPFGRNAVGSAGGMSATYNIDARGAQTGVQEQIVAALAAYDRSRPSPSASVAAQSRRYPTRRAA